jgi:hypothetical protein
VTTAAHQAQWVAESRRNSVLDRSLPLGWPTSVSPTEMGPSASQYFKQKKANRQFGNFWFPPRAYVTTGVSRDDA